MRATPANTTAPEEKLIHMITELDKIFYKIFKRGILNRSIDISPITKKIHRFRAVDDESIFSLAKDITRVFIDRIDREALRIASGTDDKKLGSIKLIERLLGNYIGLEEARRITAPIVGVYDLRIADAHPTSSKIEESFELIGIDRSQSYLKQAFHMIDEYACSIWKIGITLYKQTFTSG